MILGIRGIEESTVYQGIFAKGKAEGKAEGNAEGKVEEARKILLLQGLRRFGPPGPEVEARIAALGELDRLHELLGRIINVATWDELLSPAHPSA